MKALVLSVLAAMAFGLGACQPADAQFDARVKRYLMTHPDDLKAALENAQAKFDADEAKMEAAADVKARAALPALRAALERDASDFVANPDGKVTVTEFYDYRCPHCISIAPRVISLIRSHPEIRFVFKEMPIFGPTSEHAARAALAAKQQGKDYVGLYEALMSARPLTDGEIDRLAAAKGVDLSAMNKPARAEADQAHLDKVARLANSLAIDGTPGFVVGDAIVHGEDYEGLVAAINQAERKAGAG
jgi:protein-disulfide isomerase